MANYSKEKKREYDSVYNATHKEENKRRHREYYLKHREETIQRTSKYHQENKEWREKYYEEYNQEIRLEVLARIDPAMKCAMCGCDDTRFLEINHIKGAGNKEHKKEGNMILRIHKGKRGVEDLNLLCRACNSLDHLERVYGKTGLSVVWDKKVD